MNTKSEELKEKLRQALNSTAKVISDDFEIKENLDQNKSSKEFNFFNLENFFLSAVESVSALNFIKSLGLDRSFISKDEISLVFLSSEDLLFMLTSSAITFAVEDKAILNFSFKFVSLLLI